MCLVIIKEIKTQCDVCQTFFSGLLHIKGDLVLDIILL